MKIHIQGGTLIDPVAGTEQQQDVFIEAGKIAALGTAPGGFTADRTIDARGLMVAPGFVDLSARLREPGYEHKATLDSEMHAALAGGVTTLVCPPDTDPVLDEAGLVEMLKYRASKLERAQVHPLGALTVGLKGAVITEMVSLTEAGCIGFTQADSPIADTQVLLRALQYASTYGYPVWLRAQDAFLSKGGVAASGALASRLGLSGVPVSAETIALFTLFELMRVTGARVHVQHLSSAAGVELVRAAKAEGLPLTCDVTANHLHLTDTDIGYFDAQFRLDPPLRQQRDREALRAGVLDGTIDVICSQHTPVDDDEKLLPFAEATPGATGLELLLSLTVKWAQEANLPLAKALASITSAPATVIGKDVGRLSVGASADLCVFDAHAHWQVDPRALKSQGHNTPFLGYELPAVVRATLVAGRIGFERH
ncbi:dihydroorotase [Paraburkholderia eburnea]|uniref:Dihydroorotase n=1 Tax=Paraburkholderia eburnea TaxID=1189126 RepID=A0A2S4MNK0_9BURK|nr:dihydroorotase [Paraburkholderia eburnea]POR55927.1 dihydroorotase [Paraburkholderia eburnea]PRZ27054.1 dihydroorotase [Paraburkholderia eburnea]